MARELQVGPLKPYTKYNCTACGKAGMWTGAYLPVHQRTNDDICKMCGATLVEEIDDGRRWRVSFESVSAVAHPELYAGERARPDIDTGDVPDEYWHPSQRETSSEHDARQQVEGLNSLIAEGEFIRNVCIEVAATRWEPADAGVAAGPQAAPQVLWEGETHGHGAADPNASSIADQWDSVPVLKVPPGTRVQIVEVRDA